MAIRSNAFLVASALVAGPAWSACTDDFSAPALAPAWSFVDMDGTDGGTHALAGGKLELTGRGRDAFNTVNEFVGIKRTDIAGDFDVSVKLESQSNTHGWAQAGILAAADLSDLKKGGYVVLDATPSNGYNFFYDAAQPAGTLDKYDKGAASSGYPVWLRLAKAGNKFSAWYRKSGDAAWISIASGVVPVGNAAPSQLALVSLSHNQAVDGKAVFDDFTCLHAPTSLRMPERSVPARTDARLGSPGTFTVSGRSVPGTLHFRRP